MNDILYVALPFTISMVLTPIVKRIAFRLDAFAQINERTVHSGKIVRIGGAAIYLAFIVSMAVFMKTDMAMNGILLGGTIMFFGGLIDDFVNLRPLYKFTFQIVAAVVLIASGVTLDVIRLPLGITIPMGVISVIVTFLWITGITNAVNLIDGLDGLCGGISVIILFVIAMLAVIERRSDVEMLSLILAGATLGFLIYNAHPASIFMGDCGALFLGFIISAISLLGFKSSTIMTLALPLLLLGLPIIDTLSAILRRTLKGHKFSEADKSHIHHLLMNKFGHKNTVIIMCIVTALFGLTAYCYMINKGLGFLSLFVIMLAVEMFIEVSGMISDKYHPVLSIARRVRKKMSRTKTRHDQENSH
ncbi:MAG: MraY family glycosyltransferase [Merdibacter sp.]|nr:MraY family glycosyltransferase [Merdibacter sp.]